jgi:hypothetical protein
MSALINALDNLTPSQIGENGQAEYTWSNSIRERIVQLSFQLTRVSKSSVLFNLANHYNTLLTDIKTLSRETYLEYASILYRLIGQTRDIVDGKGEYTLSYMLLTVFHKHYPELAKFAFRYFVLGDNEMVVHPYGSWKDVKNLIKYIEVDWSSNKNKQKTSIHYEVNDRNDLEIYALGLINAQIRLDAQSDVPTLAAKWVPREKSQHDDVFNYLATDYFQEYLKTAHSPDSIRRATTKAKMEYRKLISFLNKKLDTVQIKQCANMWSEIDPIIQTSITMHKQKKAFLNKTKKGLQRSSLKDRIECANHFTAFAEKASKGQVIVKGKRIGLNDFTKNAIDLCGLDESFSEVQLLNAQWRDNSSQTGALGKMLAMVDVSGSMSGDPLNAAIALGIRIAEKSILGKRVLTFSSTPKWVNLESCTNFVESVRILQSADWGMSTDFCAALNVILTAIVNAKLPAEEVEDMVLTILSDMQMNSAGSFNDTMMDVIKDKYAQAGMEVCGKPYKPPHILFWNLRSTDGFPTLSTEKNASMVSGFSAALLNSFCEEGLSSLENCTPWSMLIDNLNNPRYMVLDSQLRQSLL